MVITQTVESCENVNLFDKFLSCRFPSTFPIFLNRFFPTIHQLITNSHQELIRFSSETLTQHIVDMLTHLASIRSRRHEGCWKNFQSYQTQTISRYWTFHNFTKLFFFSKTWLSKSSWLCCAVTGDLSNRWASYFVSSLLIRFMILFHCRAEPKRKVFAWTRATKFNSRPGKKVLTMSTEGEPAKLFGR